MSRPTWQGPQHNANPADNVLETPRLSIQSYSAKLRALEGSYEQFR
jgi:hypothetical protein